MNILKRFLYWLLSLLEPKVSSEQINRTEELKKTNQKLAEEIKKGAYNTVEEAMEEWKK